MKRINSGKPTPPPPASADDARWHAVKNRDPRAEGQFLFAVRTTRIYCRPSCPARTPRRQNVLFFSTPAEAQAAGYRPCKRCHPHGTAPSTRRAEIISRACRLIAQSEDPLPLASLAATLGLSPHHFHRIFKRSTGLTPRAYAAALRSDRLRRLLPHRPTVTEALYEAGFQSSGRFYAVSSKLLGMTPQDYRRGGRGQVIHYAIAPCTLGHYLAAASEKGFCAILLGDTPAPLLSDLQHRFPAAHLLPGDAKFQESIIQVGTLIDHPATPSLLPLDIQGTLFQCRVWQALQQIPPGTTTTYTEIARRIGQPTATRAVARACAANPLAVAIPCHRVKRRDGTLSGYRWGIPRKQALLEKESPTKRSTSR